MFVRVLPPVPYSPHVGRDRRHCFPVILHPNGSFARLRFPFFAFPAATAAEDSGDDFGGGFREDICCSTDNRHIERIYNACKEAA